MKNADLPAMPVEFSGFGQTSPEAYTGLTKREAFAMHAMQGILAADVQDEWSGDRLAACSVECADALL